jgi:CRISPR type III-B/RAMP module-associated protein Cmr5
MNKKIDRYIGQAMEELKKEDSLNKEYKGYIASLGPAINMSGLVPAIAFYSEKDEKKNKDKVKRWKVMAWIFEILKKERTFHIDQQKNMLELALSLDSRDMKKLEKDVIDISIALKLCIRTFPLTD